MGASVESSKATAAAFFDLDKTLISRSSTLAFAPSFYRQGMITRRQALRGAYAQLLFRLGGATPSRINRLRDKVTAVCKGWDIEEISQIVTANLAAVIGPLIYSEALALLELHRDSGHDVLIASTSGQEIVSPIAVMLGACATVATRLEVAGGRYTGAVEYYAYGQAKADGVREMAAQRGYRLADCYAYSDSVTDLPLLDLVGHPRVVNPDRALRKAAMARGWPVLTFSQAGSAGPVPTNRHSSLETNPHVGT